MNHSASSMGPPFQHAAAAVRVMLIREETPHYYPEISNSEDVNRLSQDMLNLDREEFRVLLLNAKHKVLGVHTVSVGSLTVSIVHPREVFKAAILANAAAIIGVHNHPSGDPTPSPEDHALTQRLAKAGSILGIQLLDHVVIGQDAMYSFADQGALSLTDAPMP